MCQPLARTTFQASTARRTARAIDATTAPPSHTVMASTYATWQKTNGRGPPTGLPGVNVPGSAVLVLWPIQ